MQQTPTAQQCYQRKMISKLRRLTMQIDKLQGFRTPERSQLSNDYD